MWGYRNASDTRLVNVHVQRLRSKIERDPENPEIILTVRGLGFVPALFLTSLIASQASVKMRPLPALVLAVLVTIISTLIFSYGLGLPFRRFGPWLEF